MIYCKHEFIEHNGKVRDYCIKCGKAVWGVVRELQDNLDEANATIQRQANVRKMLCNINGALIAERSEQEMMKVEDTCSM